MIHRISLNDCLEPFAPPAKVLNIGSLDDTVFVSICEVTQDGSRKEVHKELADISVSLPSLLEALALLASDEEREHLRPVDNPDEGTRETRLAGLRLEAPPVGPHSVVGAITKHLRYAPPRKSATPEEKP